MVYVFLFFAAGLAFAAYRATDKATRLFCIACCALNLAGVGVAVYKSDPYAFKFRPGHEAYNPDDRPVRR